MSKRDKLGIHKHTEEATLYLLILVIEAAFAPRESKLKILQSARLRGEVLKNIIRTEHELDVVDERAYLRLSANLIEISKMLNGWISYISSQ